MIGPKIGEVHTIEPNYINGWVTLNPDGLPENKVLSIRVFPNPAAEVVTVKSDFVITGIEVLSSLGQTVINKYCPGEKEVRFDVSAMPTGIYLVKVYSDQGVGTVKIAVQH